MKKNLQIIFEDNHLIVVIKPYNILTQGDQTGDIDLYYQVQQYLKEKYNKPSNVYLGLIHRLDRPVRGIIVFAKTSKAASRLSEQLRVGDFTKKYLALVPVKTNDNLSSSPSSSLHQWHTLTHYLQKNPDTNTTQVSDIAKTNYKKSILHYRIINQSDIPEINQLSISQIFQIPTQYTNHHQLVEIDLITGRSHQIRAQLSYIHLPILGDIKYSSNRSLPQKNIALLSYYLSFYHPITKIKLNFNLF